MSINPAFAEFLSFEAADRRAVFAEAEEVLGMPARYVEKDLLMSFFEAPINLDQQTFQ